MEKYEILKFKDGEFELDVNVSPEEDTVWLSVEQMSLLFNRDRTVIQRHISNVFLEGEANKNNSVQKMHSISSGQPALLYNLDIIISVGYRVKSQNGVVFRKWARNILKEYMFKLQPQLSCGQCQTIIIDLQKQFLDLKNEHSHEITFQKGEQLQGYLSIKKFLETARQSIYIIDDYFDHSFDDVLKEIGVTTTIFTDSDNIIESNEIYTVHKSKKCHDRFIFVDGVGYQLGCSLKDIGNSFTIATKLNSITLTDILKIIK